MIKALSYVQLTLLIILTHNIAASQTDIKSTLEAEEREAKELAATFLRRMTETRDINTLKDLFVADYVKRRVELEKTSLGPGQPFPLIESIPLSLHRDLTPSVNPEDWERFYTARFNLRYLWLLTFVSTFDLKRVEKQPPKSDFDIYPPRISALLRSNRFLLGDHTGEVAGDGRHVISKLQEFCDLITTLEKATTMLREDFLRKPPEKTSNYRANLKANPKDEGGIEQTRAPTYQIDESKLTLPPAPRFYNPRTIPAIFELKLVTTDAGMKIVWATVYPYK